MDQFVEKAKILNEALPYFRRFMGRTVVVKLGGSAMGEAGIDQHTAEDLVLMQTVGMHPVVVHGGGKAISAHLERLGIEPKFLRGLRVSDEETTKIAEMVLTGSINASIVVEIEKAGGSAAGLSGKDGRTIMAHKYVDPEAPDTDWGFVGEVAAISTTLIRTYADNDFIPVIAPIGLGADNATYNINADLVAGAVAGALKAEKLVLLTDQPGILEDPNDPASLRSHLTRADVNAGIANGMITGGMLPKVEACRQALAKGVAKTHIIDGRVQHALLLEIYTSTGIGTEIVS